MSGPVDVHIDELVLDGFPGEDAAAFSDSLQGELARLLRRDSPATRGGTADSVSVDLHGVPSAAGVARAVHEGIGRCST